MKTDWLFAFCLTTLRVFSFLLLCTIVLVLLFLYVSKLKREFQASHWAFVLNPVWHDVPVRRVYYFVYSLVSRSVSRHPTSFFTTIISGSKLSQCQRDYQNWYRNPSPGRYLPWCRTDGGYDDIQCHGSNCFCVDRRGNRVPFTSVSISAGDPLCYEPPRKSYCCYYYMPG